MRKLIFLFLLSCLTLSFNTRTQKKSNLSPAYREIIKKMNFKNGELQVIEISNDYFDNRYYVKSNNQFFAYHFYYQIGNKKAVLEEKLNGRFYTLQDSILVTNLEKNNFKSEKIEMLQKCNDCSSVYIVHIKKKFFFQRELLVEL